MVTKPGDTQVIKRSEIIEPDVDETKRFSIFHPFRFGFFRSRPKPLPSIENLPGVVRSPDLSGFEVDPGRVIIGKSAAGVNGVLPPEVGVFCRRGFNHELMKTPNMDFVLLLPNLLLGGVVNARLFGVFDGMSPDATGAEDSKAAAIALTAYAMGETASGDVFDPRHFMMGALRAIHVGIWSNFKHALHEDSVRNLKKQGLSVKRPGTTTQIALLLDDSMFVAWMGDSRCYIRRGGEVFMPMTYDQKYDGVTTNLVGFKHLKNSELKPLVRGFSYDPSRDTVLLTTDGAHTERGVDSITSELDQSAGLTAQNVVEAFCRTSKKLSRDDTSAILIWPKK